jgi:hypothetical protein
MANNNKKEFPINGLEEDCTTPWGRKYLCYVNNISGIKKYVKRLMNKRFRKYNKTKHEIG